MKVTILYALTATVAITGCASNQNLAELDAAKYQYERFLSVRLDAEYKAIDDTVSKESSDEMFEKSSCKNIVANKIMTIGNISGSPEHIYSTAIPISKDIDLLGINCLNANQLYGKFYMVVGFERFSIEDYTRSFLYAAEKYGGISVAVDRERSVSAKNFLYIFAVGAGGYGRATYQNPIVPVDPYIRSNGTYVAPHYRTRPNRTCLDNLSGCR